MAALTVASLAAMIAAPHAMAENKQSTPVASGSDQAGKRVGIKIGDKCERKTDRIPGAVKRDGCGRWYCGRADVKDITEVVPNIEEVAQCTWRLEGRRCLCAKKEAPK